MLDIDKCRFAGAEKDESGWLGTRIPNRCKSHAAVRQGVVIAAVGQAHPEIVAARFRTAWCHDARRTVFEHDQIAGVWLEGDVVEHPCLLAADNESGHDGNRASWRRRDRRAWLFDDAHDLAVDG